MIDEKKIKCNTSVLLQNIHNKRSNNNEFIYNKIVQIELIHSHTLHSIMLSKQDDCCAFFFFNST